jgi:hypothetical protein
MPTVEWSLRLRRLGSIALAGSVKPQAALQGQAGIDQRDAVLAVALINQPRRQLITGDKRGLNALSALSAALGADALRSGSSGRRCCFGASCPCSAPLRRSSPLGATRITIRRLWPSSGEQARDPRKTLRRGCAPGSTIWTGQRRPCWCRTSAWIQRGSLGARR